MTEKTELWKSEYSLNTKQSGEALELLTSLDNNSASLVFLESPIRTSTECFTNWLSFTFLIRPSNIKNIRASWASIKNLGLLSLVSK